MGTYNLWPKKLVIGRETAGQLAQEIKALNKARVMFFTDGNLSKTPMIARMLEDLTASGLETALFCGVGENPTDEQVHAAVSSMGEFRPDIIVAVGGGSPIDAAKAANVVYTHGGRINDYDVAAGGMNLIGPKLLPFIAVPTTAGTGSEVTWVSVITGTEKRLKFGVLSPHLIPDVSILDPEMTVSLPREITACTGMDALTHLIEAYVSVVGFPIADAMCIHGIKMVRSALPRVYADGGDIEAREDMLVASMMAGVAFNVNNLGLCHQMAHQLSAYFGIAHGLANAILLPHVMRFNAPANPKKFADIAAALGADVRGLSPLQAAEKAVETVEELCRELQIPRYLDDVGADKPLVPAMAVTALQDHVGSTNPRNTNVIECEEIFYKAFR
ncbi:MAG: iron-containing alcohol dehydrogenase family protein [Oscillospiraceae bacterium]|jgi:alcohol dehydrogenase class IV